MELVGHDSKAMSADITPSWYGGAGKGGRDSAKDLEMSRRIDKQSSSRPSKAKAGSVAVLQRKLEKLERDRQNAEKLKCPEFINQLKDKADQYLFDLDHFKSESGARLSKADVSTPLFKAIRYCRERGHREQMTKSFLSLAKADDSMPPKHRFQYQILAAFFSDPPKDWLPAYDPKSEKLLSHEFIRAVKAGDVSRLRQIVKFCEIFENTAIQEPSHDGLNNWQRWHYYVALAAYESLSEGLVPTKKHLKQLARIKCLGLRFDYAGIPSKEWEKAWQQRMATLRDLSKREWARIFADLGLGGLPRSSKRGDEVPINN